jgi:hypothetical protein
MVLLSLRSVQVLVSSTAGSAFFFFGLSVFNYLFFVL